MIDKIFYSEKADRVAREVDPCLKRPVSPDVVDSYHGQNT